MDGCERLVGAESNEKSKVSITRASWAIRARVGLTGRIRTGISRIAGRGIRILPCPHPVTAAKVSASWFSVKFSGPPTSTVTPRRAGSVTGPLSHTLRYSIL